MQEYNYVRLPTYLSCGKKELFLSKRGSVVVNVFKLNDNCRISERKKSVVSVVYISLDFLTRLGESPRSLCWPKEQQHCNSSRFFYFWLCHRK